jgi:hypothetical protein
MGCRAENQSSHRRSFRVRNELPQWKNTDRPVIRSRSCKILAASSGQRGECEWPVTNQFEGTGDVLGLQLTRGIINTVLAVAKVAFAHEFPQQMKANTPLLVTFPSDPTFRKSRLSRLGSNRLRNAAVYDVRWVSGWHTPCATSREQWHE